MIIQHTYLDLFTILLSLIFYGSWLKEVKNCRNYNASGTFTYYFISLREIISFLSYPAITDAISSPAPIDRFRSIYNPLWSIVKRSKELSKLQCLWDFNILFHKFKRKQFLFISYPAITDTIYSPRGCPQ